MAANLIADSRPLAFEHPLSGNAVYLDLAAPVRAAEHRRAAALLSAAGVDRETVAQHLLAADPVGEPWATAALADAGEAALARGAPDAAVRYLRRALDERPEPVVRAAARSHPRQRPCAPRRPRGGLEPGQALPSSWPVPSPAPESSRPVSTR